VKGKRIINIGAKVILASILVFITALFIARSVIQKKISRQLAGLSPALHVKFSSVHVDIFSASVFLDSLAISFTPYEGRQQNSHLLYFPTASLRQISFLKLLINKKLVAAEFILEGGNLELDEFLLDRKDSGQSEIFKKIEWPFEKLFIGRVMLGSIKAFLRSGEKNQLIGNGDVLLNGVSIDKPGTRPSFTGVDLRLSDINYSLAGYRIRAEGLTINSNRKVAEIQSLGLLSDKHDNQIAIASMKITGLDIDGLLNKQTLKAKRIMIGKSKVVVNKKKKLDPEVLPFDLKKINADIFQVENASVSYTDKVTMCTFLASVSLHGFIVNKPFDQSDLHFNSLKGILSAIRYSDNTYHDVEARKVELDNEKIEIDDLKIIPQLGKYQYGRKLRYQADWVQASIAKIEVNKPDINQLLHQKLLAEKITVSKAKAYVFRDRRLPRSQKIIPLPVTYMKTIPLDLRVKTFELASCTVTYEEYPREGYKQTGILRIERASAIVSPLINHPMASDPPYMTMNVQGSIMGSGTARGTILMPLQKNKPYHIKGTIERLELTKLNSSSENLGKIRIKSGFLDFLAFDFTMTEERSTGKIVGAYHHLIIQQLKKHTEEKNVADFASFMLRHLIIPLTKDKSLPEKKRTGLVNYQRDPTRLVSHYFLQSLLMGVKKSFTLGFLLPK
jgi:hypothetical protein